jgi:hypothetical protein
MVTLTWSLSPARSVPVAAELEPSSLLKRIAVIGWSPVTGSAASEAVTVSGDAPSGSGVSACSVSTREIVSVFWFL